MIPADNKLTVSIPPLYRIYKFVFNYAEQDDWNTVNYVIFEGLKD